MNFGSFKFSVAAVAVLRPCDIRTLIRDGRGIVIGLQGISWDIPVESEAGKGSTFTITLPTHVPEADTK